MSASDIARRGQFDSRDVIERIKELRDELEGLENEIKIAKLEENGDDDDIKELQAELESLLTLDELGRDATNEWSDGAGLIREDRFVEHAEDLCKDLGYISSEFPGWIEIDWEATADNLKVDYATIEWEGDTYYVRSV